MRRERSTDNDRDEIATGDAWPTDSLFRFKRVCAYNDRNEIFRLGRIMPGEAIAMVGWFGRRLGDRERGAALAEFGIVAIMLFMLVFGLIEFGRYTAFVEGVNMSTREGARFASSTNNYGDCTAIKDYTKGLSSVANIEDANISIDFFREGAGAAYTSCPTAPTVFNPDNDLTTVGAIEIQPGDVIVVTVTKDFSTVAPIVASILPARTITSVDRRSIFIGAMGTP